MNYMPIDLLYYLDTVVHRGILRAHAVKKVSHPPTQFFLFITNIFTYYSL